MYMYIIVGQRYLSMYVEVICRI